LAINFKDKQNYKFFTSILKLYYLDAEKDFSYILLVLIVAIKAVGKKEEKKDTRPGCILLCKNFRQTKTSVK
jgi:hypothetical protein